jgi:hypothetical protein
VLVWYLKDIVSVQVGHKASNALVNSGVEVTVACADQHYTTLSFSQANRVG